MNIDSKDYCDNKQCPLHTECEMEVYKLSTTYLKLNFINSKDEITIAIPCLMCKHAKRLDFGNMMRKMVTKSMLSGTESQDLLDPSLIRRK